MGELNSRIPCSTETRERVQAQKRGGESYDTLLQKMVNRYDPEKATIEPHTTSKDDSSE
jgi:hypothetical protein